MNEEKLKKVETKKYWTEEKSGVERRGEYIACMCACICIF